MFEYLITRPMGFIIKLIFDLVQNYGLSIVIFTILIKLILMPLSFKSQKAMRKTQKLQPYLRELQAKYANDKEKLQQETMKLYKENNVSMTGGCLPLLLQFPIIIGLYRVIQKPLTYLVKIDFSLPESLDKISAIMTAMKNSYPEILGKIANFTPEQIAKNYQIQLSTWSEIINGATDSWVIDFGFLGIDLSVMPKVAVNYIMAGDFSNIGRILLILIPILAVLTTWISMRISKKMTQGQQVANQTPEQAAQVAGMGKSMDIVMPITTGVFAFTLPAGLGLYWIVSNVMQILQQIALDAYFNKKGDDFDVKVPERNRRNRKNR